MKLPSKAQARELARLWASDRRRQWVSVAAPLGKTPWNDATTKALIRYGWTMPTGDPPKDRFLIGHMQEAYVLSWRGMKALAEFIAKECALSAQGIDARSDETRSASALLGESPTPQSGDAPGERGDSDAR